MKRHRERQESENSRTPRTSSVSRGTGHQHRMPKDSGCWLVSQKGGQWKCHWVWKPDFSDLEMGVGAEAELQGVQPSEGATGREEDRARGPSFTEKGRRGCVYRLGKGPQREGEVMA